MQNVDIWRIPPEDGAMSTEVTAPAPPVGLTAYVAAEIRAELGRSNISRSTLAKRLGVDDTWVGKRLNERTEISLTDLERIAAAMGRSYQTFLPRDESGGTRRYPHGPVSSLAPRPVATVGDPTRRPRAPRIGRGTRAVRLARPGIVASRRSVNRPVTPAVR